TRLHPFPFDPNHLPYEQWKALGLSERQISTIYRYEEKGGCFRVQDDLSRIYVISDEEFRILKPYVLLPETLIIDKPAGNSNDIRNLHPFTFDPNLMNETLATEIGLRERLAANMISYLRAGGRFRNADDLMRIYSITDEEFRALKPFIRIEPDTATEIVTEKRAAQLPVIELNAADTLDLQQLRGIGSSFAGRIVKYRELLGGYTDKRQLLEVYGMDSTRYLGIEYRVIVNPDSVKRINVNTASIKEMIRHPYIEFYLAKSIILHREKLGGFSALDQVGDADMMYEELFIRIRPYITIE
ncbi:MAG: helix-hairpin-helix domain-containing protein, partial [Bacteroidales bacterium]|nr:helix-hairpin-helix domain-containing protein [Bacteroidales bacterium]